MVEVSRDGRRVYLSNSLYGSWDDQFYPDGVGTWVVKLDADSDGGLAFDEKFFVEDDLASTRSTSRGRFLLRLLLLRLRGTR